MAILTTYPNLKFSLEDSKPLSRMTFELGIRSFGLGYRQTDIPTLTNDNLDAQITLASASSKQAKLTGEETNGRPKKLLSLDIHFVILE